MFSFHANSFRLTAILVLRTCNIGGMSGVTILFLAGGRGRGGGREGRILWCQTRHSPRKHKKKRKCLHEPTAHPTIQHNRQRHYITMNHTTYNTNDKIRRHFVRVIAIGRKWNVMSRPCPIILCHVVSGQVSGRAWHLSKLHGAEVRSNLFGFPSPHLCVQIVVVVVPNQNQSVRTEDDKIRYDNDKDKDKDNITHKTRW